MSHPTPKDIARQLRAVANTLDNNGDHALELADALAARGYPSVTGGSGSRSAATSTSVERAAGAHSESEENDTKITSRKPSRWDTANTDLARTLTFLTSAARATERYIDDLFDHASDEDWLPAGSGNCICCGNFVRPDYKHLERRLRGGYCPACHQAWLRWRQHHYPDRSSFVHERRAELLKRAEEREAKQRIGA